MQYADVIRPFSVPFRTSRPSTPTPCEGKNPLFKAMMIDTGDGIFFMDEQFIILGANEAAGEMAGKSCEALSGMDALDLFAPADRSRLEGAVSELKDFRDWIGEVRVLGQAQAAFAADLTVKRIPHGEAAVFCVVLRDLTEYKRLTDMLRQERNQRREMYVTLRNIMNAFEKEKRGLESAIYRKIEKMLLPALEKIGEESNADIRKAYLNILRTQLMDMTKGFQRELDGRFLNLTRTEMRICRLIREGFASKEVAHKLNISFETVQAHRRNIRGKLGLKGRKISLHSYLADKSVFQDT